MSERPFASVVVTGAAGSWGRVLVPRLVQQGIPVYGIDRDPWPDQPEGLTFHRVDILKRGFDEVLRQAPSPTALVHLAMIHRFQLSQRQRHRVNFEGTARVIEVGLRHGVSKMVFGSRAAVYGARNDQPQFLDEDYPPAAGRTMAEMQDLVAADLYACGQIWRHPEVDLAVLRFVNVLGPTVNSLLQRYLGRRRVFTIAGFDPTYQVMHERDMARAFEHALVPGLRGVFNVSGADPLPLHVLVEQSGGSRIPLPEALIPLLKGRLGFPRIPAGAVDYLKYPCTVDGRRFAEATGFAPKYDLRATLRAVAERRDHRSD